MDGATSAGDERAEQREEGANHAARLSPSADGSKAKSSSDNRVFGVLAIHRLSRAGPRLALQHDLEGLAIGRDGEPVEPVVTIEIDDLVRRGVKEL